MMTWIYVITIFCGAFALSVAQSYEDYSGESHENFGADDFSGYLSEPSTSSYYNDNKDFEGAEKRSFDYKTSPHKFKTLEEIRDDIVKPHHSDNFDYSKSYRDFVRENFGSVDIYPKVQKTRHDDNDDTSEESSSPENDESNSDEQPVQKHAGYDSEESEQDFCKIVQKDGKQCTVCKNSKTNSHSENCKYSSSPKPKRYSYSKKRNYNSKNDDSNSDEDDGLSIQPYISKTIKRNKKPKKNFGYDYKGRHYRRAPLYPAESQIHPKIYRSNSSITKPSTNLKTQPKVNSYNFDPFFVVPSSDSSIKFYEAKKEDTDWSKCKREEKDGTVCYFCKDVNGVTYEECVFVSDDEAKKKPVKEYEQSTYPSEDNQYSKEFDDDFKGFDEKANLNIDFRGFDDKSKENKHFTDSIEKPYNSKGLRVIRRVRKIGKDLDKKWNIKNSTPKHLYNRNGTFNKSKSLSSLTPLYVQNFTHNTK